MEKKLYDDCFHVEKQRWGTWQSYNKEGKKLITSLSEEQCVTATRWYLKNLQEGKFDKPTEVIYNGTVEGKL
jgi:hypothetical protein